MCGIVAYAGKKQALPILMDGLKRLEYRGYDSAGVAVMGSRVNSAKASGKINRLEARLLDMDITIYLKLQFTGKNILLVGLLVLLRMVEVLEISMLSFLAYWLQRLL